MTTSTPHLPDAPTIVLLHGLACTGALCWAPTFHALARTANVVTFDQRWHGRGIDSREFTIEGCADDVADLLDVLGLEQAFIAGYSLGGAVAQQTWRRHPDRVQGLILCSTARNQRGGHGERLFFPAYERAVATLSGYSARRVSEKRATLGAQSDDPAADGAAFASNLDWLRNEVSSTSAWAYPHVIKAVGAFNSAPWIGEIDVPTAVVVTESDRAIPTRRQLALARAIPNASIHRAPGGHASLLTDSERWLPVFLDAVDETVRRAGPDVRKGRRG